MLARLAPAVRCSKIAVRAVVVGASSSTGWTETSGSWVSLLAAAAVPSAGTPVAGGEEGRT